MSRPALILLLSVWAAACGPRVATPRMDRGACADQVREAFGSQDTTVVAVQATDGGPLFRSEILEAFDRVCLAFEDEMTDDLVAVKCLTTVPILEARPIGGARVRVARDEFPFSPAQALHFQQLVLQLEFARGDVVDRASGGRVAYIHLPHPSFEGVDLRPVFEDQVKAESGILEMVLDDGEGSRDAYRAIARDGPSSSVLAGLYDAGKDGALKDPVHLLALERFQLAAETQPKVSQSFSIADDIKTVRRGLHQGLPGEAYIPPARAEVAQLLLALSLAPGGNMFGPRLDSRERVGLLRINLAAQPQEAQRRLARKLDVLLARSLAPGAAGFLCLDD